jgi:hypothetical protein
MYSVLSTCPQFPLNQLTNPHDIQYEYYATGDHPNLIPFNFLQSIFSIEGAQT